MELSEKDLEAIDSLPNKLELINIVHNEFAPREILFIYQYVNNLTLAELILKSIPGPICCNWCGSINFKPHDKRKFKNHYECKDCKKTFTPAKYEWFPHLHESSYKKLVKFVALFLSHATLRDCAKACDIALQTAFDWRHRILDCLNSLMNSKENTTLTGLIQMDETYFSKSNKGSTVGEGKKARKHGYEPGYEDLPGLSKDKICVTTAYDDSNRMIIKIVGEGKPKSDELYEAYKDVIVDPKNTTIIADGDTSYPKFVEMIGCKLITLKKPELKNGKKYNPKMPVILKIDGKKYHIQNINAFHSTIDRVINGNYRGVATKYLTKYINSLKWEFLNNRKKINKIDSLLELLRTTSLH